MALSNLGPIIIGGLHGTWSEGSNQRNFKKSMGDKIYNGHPNKIITFNDFG